jgi:hypothetical protein
MLHKRALLVVVIFSLAFSVCPSLYGQATGSFSGTVSDKAGAVVSGATVKATSQGTGVAREAKTDDSGYFLIPLLPVAIYTIRVDAKGFGPAEQKDVRLQVDEHRELDFALAPASVSTAVEVSATEVAVETANPTLGQVITSEQVAELPLNGRDFVQLATLTPGTTQETNPNSFFNAGPSSEVSTRGTFSLSVGGSRAQSTDWLLDGNDNNELTAGGIAILPSIDAIQEFKVLTYNYSAEWGTRAGPTVLVTTKSGTNRFHGSLFEFFRNTKLDAKNYDFGIASPNQKFNLNEFGGALGGAIQKDRTFFFVDYQGKRQRRGIPFTGLVPTQAMIGSLVTGADFSLDPLGLARGVAQPQYNNTVRFPHLTNLFDFQPFQCDASDNPIPAGPGGVQPAGAQTCDKIPGNMIDPTGQKILELYPQSNASNAGLGFNFANTPVRSINEGEFDIRLDHNFSAKDSAFARFSYDQAVSFVPGGSPPGFAELNTFGSSENIQNHGRNIAVSETHVLSDRTVNQVNAGFNRIFNHFTSAQSGTCYASSIGIQGSNLGSACDSITGYPASLNQSTKDCISCGMTSVLTGGGYWSVGDRGFSPFQGGTNVFSISDSFDMIRGKHDVRVGMGIRAQQMNVESGAFQDGFLIPFGISGDDTADLLLGQAGLGIHDQTFRGATTGRRWKLFRPFVQDEWRVSNSLTLSLGFAWAFTTPIKEAENRQANFDFATGQLFVAGNTSAFSSALAGCTFCVPSGPDVGIQLDKTAIEPRIGFAWKPFNSPNTAIRGGYAIFHDSSWNQGGQGLWENPPYFAESDNFNGVPSCPFGNTTINCGVQRVFLQSLAGGAIGPYTTPPPIITFPGTLYAQNLDFKQGRVQQFNLNVEHQIPGNIVVTAGYAGSRSSHILVDGLNQNVHSPTACGVQPGYTLGCGLSTTTNPYPTFGTISNQSDDGQATYNSFQAKAETKSARHGIYALIGYTYSHTYDSGMVDGLGSFPGATYWPLPGTHNSDWGLSQINLNHQFTASVTYNLPFGKGKKFGSNWSGAANAIAGGWEVNTIERAISGFPLFVVDSNNSSGVNFQWNGSSVIRPNEVGDPNRGGQVAANSSCNAPAQVHTLQNWFNPCAFVEPLAGELGTASRAPVSGPRFINTDLSFVKHFALPYEGMRVDFRAEFFNLFNHPHFYLPGSSGVSNMQDINAPSTFGVISSTLNDPRLIQLALKLVF